MQNTSKENSCVEVECFLTVFFSHKQRTNYHFTVKVSRTTWDVLKGCEIVFANFKNHLVNVGEHAGDLWQLSNTNEIHTFPNRGTNFSCWKLTCEKTWHHFVEMFEMPVYLLGIELNMFCHFVTLFSFLLTYVLADFDTQKPFSHSSDDGRTSPFAHLNVCINHINNVWFEMSYSQADHVWCGNLYLQFKYTADKLCKRNTFS